jgi:tetratricopeptide (TPR) repeat protein
VNAASPDDGHGGRDRDGGGDGPRRGRPSWSGGVRRGFTAGNRWTAGRNGEAGRDSGGRDRQDRGARERSGQDRDRQRRDPGGRDQARDERSRRGDDRSQRARYGRDDRPAREGVRRDDRTGGYGRGREGGAPGEDRRGRPERGWGDRPRGAARRDDRPYRDDRYRDDRRYRDRFAGRDERHDERRGQDERGGRRQDRAPGSAGFREQRPSAPGEDRRGRPWEARDERSRWEHRERSREDRDERHAPERRDRPREGRDQRPSSRREGQDILRQSRERIRERQEGPRERRDRPWEGRDERRGRPWEGRDERRGPRREGAQRERPGEVRREGRDRYPQRPARPTRDGGPELPEDVKAEDLDREVRTELRSLARPIAERVARHLVAAGRLVDDDPATALAHAVAARRLASRIAAVREAVGITAYHAGEWQTAAAELRTYHRMTGRQTHLAVLADCERALGRPEKAIDIYRSADREQMDRTEAIELLIVAAGARRDMGQDEAAVAMLQIRELAVDGPWSARLRYAYADGLLAVHRADEAREWFARALEADDEGQTDAAERLLDLDGVALHEAAEGEDEAGHHAEHEDVHDKPEEGKPEEGKPEEGKSEEGKPEEGKPAEGKDTGA